MEAADSTSAEVAAGTNCNIAAGPCKHSDVDSTVIKLTIVVVDLWHSGPPAELIHSREDTRAAASCVEGSQGRPCHRSMVSGGRLEAAAVANTR